MIKRLFGIFVCMLLIVTALSATGTMNVKTTQYVKENNCLEPYQSSSVKSPGVIAIKIVAEVFIFEDPFNLLGGAIKVNDRISGKYVYDSGVPDEDPDPHGGLYWHNSSTFGIELKAGGFVFKTNPGDPCLVIVLYNDCPYDQYDLFSSNNLQLSNGMKVDEIMMRLKDDTGTALSSDALPTTAPVLSDWDEQHLIAIIGSKPSDPSQYFLIAANITKFTKSRTRDVSFTTQPILNWLLERFPMLQELLNLIKIRLR